MNHSFQNIALHPGTGIPTLFLPGWGFDGSILRLLKPAPEWISPATPLDPETFSLDLQKFLVANNIRKVRLVGWSMGAMLALEFGAKQRDLVDSLVLISLRSHWPANEIKELKAEFLRNPEAFLKDFYRKCFIGDRATYRNFCSTLEPLYLAALQTNKARLERGLDFLGTFKLPGPQPGIPTRLVHGRQDIIAPVTEIPRLQDTEVEIIDTAGHAVFLHADSSLQQEFKKKTIQLKFSRAAESYDNYAKVQAEVALKLAAKLPPAGKRPDIKTILEIGCGTGNFTSLLAARFPAAKIAALDFSPEMIAKARHKLQSAAIDFICAEGEGFLEKAPAKSFDLVVSNGSLQWFSDIDRVLHNISRILSPGGRVACSIFGPESLKELGQGLQALQSPAQNVAAHGFPQPARLRHALHLNFLAGKVEEELLEKEYRSAHDLLLHIKKTGTSGWQQNQRQPLTPARINRLDKWFAKTHGSCRVTYHIIFLQGKN